MTEGEYQEHCSEMQMPDDRDTLNDRTKLRASQQRKLDHACEVIEELIKLHMPDDLAEREIAELSMVKLRLAVLIRHQHVKDRVIADARIVGEVGDY